MADVSYKALVNDDEAPSSGSATSDSVPISPPVSSDDTSASNDTSNVEAGATADSKKKIPYTRQQKTILVIVMISQFFAMTSISLPAPFLPKMVSKTVFKRIYLTMILNIEFIKSAQGIWPVSGHCGAYAKKYIKLAYQPNEQVLVYIRSDDVMITEITALFVSMSSP